jgi:Coenzyme PQQ synthesis protein D (PqqD)
MKITDKIIVSPQVVAREMGTEVVILELQSGSYFGLDEVGARIWRLIGMGKSLAEVCDEIVREYEISREVLERDVLAFVRDLGEKKLVSVE